MLPPSSPGTVVEVQDYQVTAYIAGEVAGLLHWDYTAGPTVTTSRRNVNLEYLIVYPKYRRRGVASAMILALLRRLRREPVVWVLMGTGDECERDGSTSDCASSYVSSDCASSSYSGGDYGGGGGFGGGDAGGGF